MLRSDSRFVLDNNLIIAAIKSGWKKSTDLLFEYEKYINKILGLPHLFLLIQRRSTLIDPSMDYLQTILSRKRVCRCRSCRYVS